MGSRIEVEIAVKDKTDHPSTDVVPSPQWQTEFQSASPTVPQSLVSPPTLNPPNIVDESASINVLTSREIRIVKQRNPVKALRKLQQILRLSTDVPLPSSTIVPPLYLNDEVVFILQQLKVSLFEGDFLHALEKE